MRLVFPPEWEPIIARILESGAQFVTKGGPDDFEKYPFAPVWGLIPFTTHFTL